MNNEGGKKIFVSRSLKSDSPFHKLTTLGYEVSGTSLIKISYLDFDPPSNYGAVFFYSQKAIRHFLATCPYDTAIAYGVMGKGSAEVFRQLTGLQPEITGQGQPAVLADKINLKWKGHTVLFPQAQQSMRSLETLLTEVVIENLVVYDNEMDSGVELRDFDVLAFTSPLNVRAYLKKRSIAGKQVVAIGATTAGVIKELTGMEVSFCEQPSEVGLYELVREGLNHGFK